MGSRSSPWRVTKACACGPQRRIFRRLHPRCLGTQLIREEGDQCRAVAYNVRRVARFGRVKQRRSAVKSAILNFALPSLPLFRADASDRIHELKHRAAELFAHRLFRRVRIADVVQR